LAFDSLGALYIADSGNHRIQKLIIGTSTGLTVAGQANVATGNDSYHLYGPVHMAFDSNDNMYVSDRQNSRVQFFIRGNLSGTTVAGITGNWLFFYKLTFKHKIFIGSSGSTNNTLFYLTAVAYDSQTNNLYIADTNNNRVMQYQYGSSAGSVIAGRGGYGLGASQLSTPFGLYFDTFSNSLIISNCNLPRIVWWKIGDYNGTVVAGSFTGVVGNDSTFLNVPFGVSLDPMGNIYVADMANHRIQFFLSGQFVGRTIAGITGVSGTNASVLYQPRWVTLDKQLNLYVCDTDNHRVQMFRRY